MGGQIWPDRDGGMAAVGRLTRPSPGRSPVGDPARLGRTPGTPRTCPIAACPWCVTRAWRSGRPEPGLTGIVALSSRARTGTRRDDHSDLPPVGIPWQSAGQWPTRMSPGHSPGRFPLDYSSHHFDSLPMNNFVQKAKDAPKSPQTRTGRPASSNFWGEGNMTRFGPGGCRRGTSHDIDSESRSTVTPSEARIAPYQTRRVESGNRFVGGEVARNRMTGGSPSSVNCRG